MKIVNIPRRFTTSHWGGTETVILETAKHLTANGHSPSVVCPNALAEENFDLIENLPVQREPYCYPYWGLSQQSKVQMDLCGGNMFSFALKRRLMKSKGLDLLHLHTLKRIGGIGRYVALRRNLPYVVTLHGGVSDVPTSERDRLKKPYAGAIEWGKILGWWIGSRRVLDDANAIICVGKIEYEKMSAQYPNKTVIYLPNGVDYQRFANGNGAKFRQKHKIRSGANLLLTIGRIDPQKNQLWLVRQLPELLKTDSSIHLLFVGHVTDPDYYSKLTSEVESLGLTKKVTILPGIKSDSQDLVDCYHSANSFILPSRHEPFGIVILEAWAAGLPVLASRIGGLPSLINDGRDGLLFDSDQSRDFIINFKRLINKNNKWKQLAENGRLRSQYEFDWMQITGQLMEIYENVCSR